MYVYIRILVYQGGSSQEHRARGGHLQTNDRGHQLRMLGVWLPFFELSSNSSNGHVGSEDQHAAGNAGRPGYAHTHTKHTNTNAHTQKDQVAGVDGVGHDRDGAGGHHRDGAGGDSDAGSAGVDSDARCERRCARRCERRAQAVNEAIRTIRPIRAIRGAIAQGPLARNAVILEPKTGAQGGSGRTAAASAVDKEDGVSEEEEVKEEEEAAAVGESLEGPADCWEESAHARHQATISRVCKRVCLARRGGGGGGGGGGRGGVVAPVSGGEYLSAGAARAKTVEDWRETVEQEAREGLMFATALVQMMQTTKIRCAGRDSSQG